MNRRIRGSVIFCIAISLAAAPVVSCSKAREYSTWESLGQRSGTTKEVQIERPLPASACPWAGTVSHHLLTYAQIDGWFRTLASRRDVSRFYVLSPSHWGLSTQTYSLTDGSWRVKGGFVDSDRAQVASLARKLGVKGEPRVFDGEHGVSTLMPFIARYFPRAKVIAIAYHGEPPLDQPMAARLYEALAPAFAGDARKENFLLVSTDFSHHGDRAQTAAKDARTRKFFDAPSASSWIMAGCDNRPGIYVLSRLLDAKSECSVLYHCDSSDLTGVDDGDITSYFFSFFW